MKGGVFSVFAFNFLLYCMCNACDNKNTCYARRFRQPLASENPCVTVIIVMLLGIILFLIYFILMTSLVGFSFLNDNAQGKSEKLDLNLLFKSFVHAE